MLREERIKACLYCSIWKTPEGDSLSDGWGHSATHTRA
jgi:hypothetical protein